jgi:hypothetical protein
MGEPQRTTLLLLQRNLAARLCSSGKIHLTGLCNRPTTRATAYRSIPERLAYTKPTARCTGLCSAQHAAFGRLSTAEPQVETRLTAHFQLKQNRSHPSRRGRTSTAPGDTTSRRRFQPRARLFDSASDAPCHTPLDSEAESCEAPRTLPRAPASTGASIQARSIFHRQVLPKEPATVLEA